MPAAGRELGAGREFAYTMQDFERVRGMIYARAGIRLEASKFNMVYSRLSRRLRALSLSSFRAYLDLLDADDAHEWQAFTNALTTNLTSFFREPHHFDVMEKYLAEHGRRGAKFRIWSAACSTGEEAYSIAMRVVEHFNSWTPPVQIIASDLDTTCLDTAAAGAYPLARLENLPPALLKRFFMRGRGANEGKARVRQEVRKLVEFQQLNLLSDAYPVEGVFDIIFCRNVMIYFDKATQRKVVERLAARLRPDGLYFAGHSESLLHVSDTLKLVGQTVYAHAEQAEHMKRIYR